MMVTNARIPKVDRANPILQRAVAAMAELAELKCDDTASFWGRSKAARAAMADIMWEDEEQRLETAVTDALEVTVDGEKYRRLSNQPSSMLVHGLWGAHRVHEKLYRLIGVHNGPTLKPLLCRIGVVSGSLLPDLADEAGELLLKMTSREVETTMVRQGFRPPSRTTLAKRLGGLHQEMSTCARELEEACRDDESLDFQLGAISCGLDRFAVRMDEELPPGLQRDLKLAQRRPHSGYERTPPEPYVCHWRMAWSASVTMYDTDGVPRRSLRYSAEPGHDAQVLAARMVDDIIHLCHERTDVHVACIQDGAGDLEVLRAELRERLPEGVPRRHVVDFHHAISYLDAVVAARDDGDPDNLAGWYRTKLLTDDNGAAHIVKHLRRRISNLPKPTAAELPLADALHAASRYFSKRRSSMKYAEVRALGLPIGSGATESTCGLLQLRVKHPGSHWRTTGLHSTLTATAWHHSGRWATAFQIHHASLVTLPGPP